jgi:hypothetical protein
VSKKTIAVMFVSVLAPLIIYLIWPTDESRIKTLFREGARSVEEEDINGIMLRVSFHYRDDNGLTYLYIKEYMKAFLQRMDDIKVDYENLQIDIDGDTALAQMEVRVIATTGGETGYVFGDFPNPVQLTFTLEKEQTKWLVVNTDGLPVEW